MQPATQGDVSQLLAAIRAGDAGAQSLLAERLWPRFRSLAGRLLADEPTPASLQPSDLVDEAFLHILRGKLFSKAPDRIYLFRAAAKVMRHVLVEHARRRRAEKRGGNRQREPFSVLLDYCERKRIDAVALHDALEALSSAHERAALVMTLRTLGGYTEPEVAELLGASLSTVQKDTQFARAWLRRELGGDAP